MKKLLLLVFLCRCFFSHAQTPDWVWARYAHISINGDGESAGIAVDSHYNVFITGYFIDSVSFGSYSLGIANTGAYLAKYDASGNIKWAKSNTSSSNLAFCAPYSVCTDKSGNSYITGTFG